MTAILRGGVAVIFLGLGVAAYADKPSEIGPVVSVTGEPNQASHLAEDYSCGVVLTTDVNGPITRFQFHNVVQFGDRALHLLIQESSTDVEGAIRVVSPKQEFTLYAKRFAESAHVTQHSIAIFQGSYHLWPTTSAILREPLALTFFQAHFPRVKTSDADGVNERSYFILPTTQLPTVLSVLSGGEPTAPPTAGTFAPEVRVQPGLVRTGGGTYYHFHPNGVAVTIYRRGRPAETISLVPEREELAYASHAAILRRMGVEQPEKMTPAQQIVAAIRKNVSLYEAAGLSAVVRGLLAYSMDRQRAAYETWRVKPTHSAYEASSAGCKRDTMVWAALNETNNFTKAMPSELRWHTCHDMQLSRAPISTDGHPAIRVIRPFLVFGENLRSDAEAEPKDMRIAFERSALHLQLAHAYLGAFALDLDKYGAMGGGIVEYEYEAADPTKLLRVAITDHGFVSLHTGRRSELSPKALKWVLQKLQSSLPFRSDAVAELTVGLSSTSTRRSE